jgi:hypothetical protein
MVQPTPWTYIGIRKKMPQHAGAVQGNGDGIMFPAAKLGHGDLRRFI